MLGVWGPGNIWVWENLGGMLEMVYIVIVVVVTWVYIFVKKSLKYTFKIMIDYLLFIKPMLNVYLRV